MAHGHKDYAEGGETKIIHAVTDLGELAVRLGSPDVFQRSGNVIFIDSFENGLTPYFSTLAGTGAAIDHMGNRSFHGGSSVRLIGGSDGGRRAELNKRFHIVELNKMGVECTFSMGANAYYVAITLNHWDGTNVRSYVIYANMDAGKFQYYDEDGNRQDLDTFDWGNDDLDHWHTMKMICDLENNKYVRAFYNEKNFSLADIPVRTIASADVPRLDLDILVISDDGENGIAYLDSFILTINEP